MFLGKLLFFGSQTKKSKNTKEEKRDSGNHKEQRTGFKNSFNSFFSRFPNERRIFTHVEKKRERKRKNRNEEKSPTVHHDTQTSIIGAHTHAARARAKEEEEKFYA